LVFVDQSTKGLLVERLNKGLFSKEQCGPSVVHWDKACRRKKLFNPFYFKDLLYEKFGGMQRRM
jgi:hypothetical protein